MAQIRNKLKEGEYANITEMTADFYLMLDNARKAFPPHHRVHKVSRYFIFQLKFWLIYFKID